MTTLLDWSIKIAPPLPKRLLFLMNVEWITTLLELPILIAAPLILLELRVLLINVELIKTLSA
jgi:hypothetical protein